MILSNRYSADGRTNKIIDTEKIVPIIFPTVEIDTWLEINSKIKQYKDFNKLKNLNSYIVVRYWKDY